MANTIQKNREVTAGAPGDSIAPAHKESKNREGQRTSPTNRQEDNLRAKGIGVGTGMVVLGTGISMIPHPAAQAIGRTLQAGGGVLVTISANTACPAPIAAVPQSTTQGPPLQKKPEDIDPSKISESAAVLEVPRPVVGFTDGYKVYSALKLLPDENATQGIEILVREKDNNPYPEMLIIPNAYILKNIKGVTKKYSDSNEENYKDPNFLIKKDNYKLNGENPNVSVEGARISRIKTKKGTIVDIIIGTDGKYYVVAKPQNEKLYAISMCSATAKPPDTKLRYDFKRIPKSPMVQRIGGDIIFGGFDKNNVPHTGTLDYRKDKTYIKTVIPSVKDNLGQIFVNPNDDKLIFKPDAKEIIESLDIPQDQKRKLLSEIEPNEETLISSPKKYLYHYLD